MGTPMGIPDHLRKVLEHSSSEEEITDKPCTLSNSTDTFEHHKEMLEKNVNKKVDNKDVLSLRVYPRGFEDYLNHCHQFGETTRLPTPVFFFGLREKEEIAVDLETGKTLFISLKGVSQADSEGKCTVFFNVNGFNRIIEVSDTSKQTAHKLRSKANPAITSEIGAPMPGKVINIAVEDGQCVTKGETLIVTEAMKMEYCVTAMNNGVISKIMVSVGDQGRGMIYY